MRILGVDPGKNTGFCLVEVHDGKIVPTANFGVDRNAEIDSIIALCAEGIDRMIIEDFKVRPGDARQGNFDYDDMVAPRVIGKLELLCSLHKIPYSKQQASLKPPAYGFAGMRYVKGKKNQHWQDAFAHAVYYCVKELGCAPVKGR